MTPAFGGSIDYLGNILRLKTKFLQRRIDCLPSSLLVAPSPYPGKTILPRANMIITIMRIEDS